MSVEVVELRVLDGPNLYFPRPAIKLTLDVGAWLALPEARVERVASGLSIGVRPGRPSTEQRRRAVARLAASLAARLATATGVRLAVRARPGPEPEQIVVAYPWRRRAAAEAAGRELADLLGALLDARRSAPRQVEAAARRLADVPPGPEPSVPDPAIRVVSVTGTNGKTTIVRLLAHLVRAAGLRVAYATTDGVYRDEDELVEEGDYSGFGGAAKALEDSPDVAVLETARGGILLRGIGVLHNDAAVVTNVSEDHLGLHGIHTLDQLAEVKASITRITRPEGWDVLNADDPRVLAMRRGASGRPWISSRDPDHPAVRAAVTEGGRATTVIDGQLTYLTAGMRSHALLPLEDIPLTLAGISTHNTQNAMAVASAALGIGLSHEHVAKGLRTFVLDPETNPGRTNLFELDGRIVVADYAHNEAGLQGLVEVCGALRRAG